MCFLGFNRLDDQVFVNRNQGIPTVIKFHPYQPYIAVADKESIRYNYDCYIDMTEK